MLSPEYLADVATPIIQLWAEVEDDILADVARRIVRTGYASAQSKWEIAKVREMGLLEKEITAKLKKMTGLSERKVKAIIKEACREALVSDDKIYIAAGLKPIPIASSAALQEVILAGARKTNGLMSNFTKTTARTTDRAFENALDLAYLQITSGAFSSDQALRMAINSLAKQGIETIAYPSGGVERLDSAARRAIVTGVNQTAADITLTRAKELESDLVETTSHAGARPSHALWQGKVFSLSGKTKGYGDFYAETGYGTGAGLCGWNCRHSFYPYIEGFSTPSFSRDPARQLGKSNDRVYEESQKQRAYERAIRESKRECVTLDAAMSAAQSDELRASLKEDFAAASVKLKKREAKLAEYLKQTGRTRDKSREYTHGFGASTSAKAVWANRKAAQGK